jgi:hypothetical protein
MYSQMIKFGNNSDILNTSTNKLKLSSCMCSKVLIADDEQFNVTVLEGLLDFYDIKCDSAYNGL